jgi:polysaccharide export outer membrane protein
MFRLLMLRRIICICIFAFVPYHLSALQQDTVSPGELVQYIRDAKKAGLSDQQIQKNAVAAGWTRGAVTDAIALVTAPPANSGDPLKSGSQPKPATPADSPKAPPASVPAGAPASGNVEPSVNRGVPDDYEIGAGDVITINVWKEPEASIPSVVVRPDGKISMPLLKDVSVVGLTPKQAEQSITDKLGKFINGADVTVVVTGINSKKVYLIGAVKKEGPLAYTYRMSVMQALSEAGGLTDYAKRKKIYVLRTESGKQFKLGFDYDAVLKGEHMELNIFLMAGDTIVVPH